MEYYLKVWRNYAVFEGRARRTEYWMFFLINVIIGIVFSLLVMAFHWFKVIEVLYNIAIILPSLAVVARRLHDTGRSGWWQLIALIPFVGWIILLVFLCLDSDDYDNEYGPNPKRMDSDF